MTQSAPPPSNDPVDPPAPAPPGASPPGPGWSGDPSGRYAPQGSAPTSYPWATGGPPARPGMVTGAAIVLLVLGVLTAILGLFALLAASIFTSGMDIPGMEQFGRNAAGAIGGIIAIVGGVFIVFGVLQVVSGINLFSARSWARILAIVLCVIGALFGLLALLGSGEPGANSSPIFGLILLLANGFVVWALATTGRYFTR